jgi:hypothetical protein
METVNQTPERHERSTFTPNIYPDPVLLHHRIFINVVKHAIIVIACIAGRVRRKVKTFRAAWVLMMTRFPQPPDSCQNVGMGSAGYVEQVIEARNGCVITRKRSDDGYSTFRINEGIVLSGRSYYAAGLSQSSLGLAHLFANFVLAAVSTD